MTCREFIAFIVEYLDGALPQDGQAHFESHLTRCPDCGEYLRQYRATITLCREAFRDAGAQAAPEMPEDLVRAVLNAIKRA